ncbi:fused MFS/spermidine synthase [Novosphingobium lentum]|uniref:fused MFS/spermidine synthase n=1 Tax=Novosphingobium lentum TaxID=145287 RepID=UPI00082CBF1E|nr:fused MFS/spermidine synthase [Novosphingobium lentum]
MKAAPAASSAAPPVSRTLFVVTILTGSFLLFLVQPMVARAALPRLGGSPNVWNSAMLVYQALLLGGYAYAHWLGRWPIRTQATIHLALLALAALTLPVHLAALAPPRAGTEALWVPLLFAASIGPVFFMVSAQAPLMQRWFAAHPGAGEPWALYAASNLGSFAGLLSYPLLVEPLMPLHAQEWAWSIGYGALVVLIVLAALARRGVATTAAAPVRARSADTPVPARRIVLWLALAAVPSGLMLSTTTHLTTDIFAMPLLWVIPLGLYLLSFSVAFAENRTLADMVTGIAPVILLLAGSLAMNTRSAGTLTEGLAAVLLLFAVSVALHAQLHATRPAPGQLTLFYLVMSAGGVLGGLFCALLAPVLFDWVWEHPVLVIAAALLLPQRPPLGWMAMPDISPAMRRMTLGALLLFALFLGQQMAPLDPYREGLIVLALTLGLTFCGIMVLGVRPAFVAIVLIMMLARGGVDTIETSLSGLRTRSYFGIYTVRDDPANHQRTLAHGTTLHGMQFTDAARRRQPTTYYGAQSGIGLAMANAAPDARVGVVGLGTATLACYKLPGQDWTYFEIDPAVVALSKVQHHFTFLDDCAPDAHIRLGDARIELDKVAPASFDLLAIDAFSSDAIPLHLLTREAFAIYGRALAPHGVLMVHVSNRYIDLEPAVAALARAQGMTAAVRLDRPLPEAMTAQGTTPSIWIALSRDPGRLSALTRTDPAASWHLPERTAPRAWTDDRASILPYIRWNKLIGI